MTNAMLQAWIRDLEAHLQEDTTPKEDDPNQKGKATVTLATPNRSWNIKVEDVLGLSMFTPAA